MEIENPRMHKQLIRDANGTYFEMWWDGTNGTIHLVSHENDGVKMYDFKQTRAIEVQKK